MSRLGTGRPLTVRRRIPTQGVGGPEVTLWMIPESPHIGGLSTRPEEYRQRVLALFDGALG